MPADSYERLVAKLKRAHYLGTVAGLLGWDEQVNLPPDSADQRAEQLALLAELQHAAASDPEIGALLAELEGADESPGHPCSSGTGTPSASSTDRTQGRDADATANTSPTANPVCHISSDKHPGEADRRVVMREARRDYDRVVKLPASFVAEKARLSSAAYHMWADAKSRSDFSAFAPFLEKHLALAKQEAAYLGWADRPYDYAIDKHDPGMTAAKLTELFAELKAGLVPLVRRIAASPVRAKNGIFNGFPVEAQREFLRDVTERLGFNYRRGRIDVSLHPFCEGSGADIRMTTRFDADNPLDSLFSSIHETGHGLYEQGLPLSAQGTPLGQNAGMGVHESQSRLWENQVSRSRAFWTFFEPRFRDKFPTQLAAVSSDDLYLAVNEVSPTLIRVDSDEVHYNLHILLRFELERRLFSGDLAVQDLPAAWNALSQELLGLTPPADGQGVLQDVHWSGGAFGYFPSYCLGNMIAAQLWATVRTAYPTIEDDFTRGDFGRLLAWLRANIHQQGRRYETLELVRRVTGEELTPKYLLRYLEERYAPLYLASWK